MQTHREKYTHIGKQTHRHIYISRHTATRRHIQHLSCWDLQPGGGLAECGIICELSRTYHTLSSLNVETIEAPSAAFSGQPHARVLDRLGSSPFTPKLPTTLYLSSRSFYLLHHSESTNLPRSFLKDPLLAPPSTPSFTLYLLYLLLVVVVLPQRRWQQHHYYSSLFYT